MTPINMSYEKRDKYNERNKAKRSNCWKDKGKQRHQYRRTVSILIEPGYAVLTNDCAYIQPFVEVRNYK